MDLSFKFIDDQLNDALLALLKKAKAKYRVTSENVICYGPEDEDLIENELISQIRDTVFPSWQLVSCPPDSVGAYRHYMLQHEVPFKEELIDNEISFLIPRSYRPHSWRLEPSAKHREATKTP